MCETGTGQQVVQVLDSYVMMMIIINDIFSVTQLLLVCLPLDTRVAVSNLAKAMDF
jgi:hypothetical protein